MPHKIFDVFEKVGYLNRPTTIFADYYSRTFSISSDGTTLRITVSGGDKSLLAEQTVVLEGEFIFNTQDQATNATLEQMEEIFRWIHIRPIPNIGALLS
jgi:hypothetical protein